jgi:hypothetical protein
MVRSVMITKSEKANIKYVLCCWNLKLSVKIIPLLKFKIAINVPLYTSLHLLFIYFNICALRQAVRCCITKKNCQVLRAFMGLLGVFGLFLFLSTIGL